MSDETLEYLKRIDKRLSRLEAQVIAVRKEGVGEVMNVASIMGDSLDDHFSPETTQGRENLDSLESLRNLLVLVQQRETIETMTKLLETLKQTAPLIEQLGQAENVLSVIADSTDEFFKYAMDNGLKIDELVNSLKVLSFKMLELLESGAFVDMVNSGVMDAGAVEIVGNIGKSLGESRKQPTKLGPMGVFSALMSSEVQTSLGFLINFGKHFGETINAQHKQSEKKLEYKG